MDKKFHEYKGLDLSRINKEVLEEWEKQHTFEQSLETREGDPLFVFYEGPPSANGMPGIHHVMARTIKDIVCRYKTLRGFRVERKAGWDTHGLPVELSVEKKLGITKEEIGKSIPVETYNAACRADVMKYTGEWEDLTRKMGYWVDMHDPYITYDNRYIETLWWLLKRLHEKGFLYKGYTIQPYSPAAGTGLSTHELNQPGCYRDVKDTTCVALFKVTPDARSPLFAFGEEVYLSAWTTTPWTLPSNTALAVGAEITYAVVKSYNPYTAAPVTLVMAAERVAAYFHPKGNELPLDAYKEGDKVIPYRVVSEVKGRALAGTRYEQLIPWMTPEGDAFRVITGDFVTTEDGTGIVHIAPTFGADDDRAAKAAGIAPMMLVDRDGNRQPMVDRRGRLFPLEDIDPAFLQHRVRRDLYGEYAGRFVKNAYDPALSDDDPTLDVDLCVMLKRENKAFKVEKHVHNYPHCWRTDKPVLYYPLDSWFIKTTAVKERMMELNKTIHWKPASTGEGRFGKWLENLVDWNLSRSRYWGTPLPIWTSEEGECKCIGSVQELTEEIERAVAAGVMKRNPYAAFTAGDYSAENYEKIDLHRPFVDEIILVSPSGRPMTREKELIDVWFDSGAMPYAQCHYPFEHRDDIDRGRHFPADFIAEGVDQTRGWFFTLHAIAVMLFDSVAFRNIISNGLVLDAKGNKMSKRLGNAVDPFQTIEEHGSDPLRWYMITNAQPWDNLKFDLAGVDEVKRKFFGTLYNTYSFFALYANIDGFTYAGPDVPADERPELDRWILSLLNTLVKEVTAAYEQYEPTRAGRVIQEFVIEHLSNWYVRLSRKRYWGGEPSADKLSAYQTLYTCLETVAVLASPIAPFYTDRLYTDLNRITGKHPENVHLTRFPTADERCIDKQLEERMAIAQQISSMVLGLRRKVQIRVRQPLSRLLVPVTNEAMIARLDAVKSIILSEVNVKALEYITDTAGVLIKKIKPNFKTLGPKHGKQMKQIAGAIEAMTQDDIYRFERDGTFALSLAGQALLLTPEDVEILSEDIPGWLVANEGNLTVALDVNITQELREEGIAREFINRIQNLRKERDFNVTDKITLQIEKHAGINEAIEHFKGYIAGQVLADEITLTDKVDGDASEIEIDDIHTVIQIRRAYPGSSDLLTKK
ncbi:MAG: isoleucine--tRNA ligase [Odoribacteraceae bacterium]|jgi:isoleucyl-tRNA synthetase|nr:isoleucine--tRNA ligase [Odoribacteraceae bacterium]